MNFIKNKHNEAIVNLDLVTSIWPSTTGLGIYKINFVFDSMSNEANNEIEWIFEKLSDFKSVLASLDVQEA